MKLRLIVLVVLTYSGLHSQNNFQPAQLQNNQEQETQNKFAHITTYDHYFAPPAPIITTNPANLEICSGMSTTLTASSSDIVYWYTTPPPNGTPVGTGTTYVTPELSTGYYVYYAIAHNARSYSSITSVDVVMVYPLPTVSIVSSHEVLCTGESATLTARGTSFYSWNAGIGTPTLAVNPSKTTTFSVTGINTAGCRSNFTFTQKVKDCEDSDLKPVNTAIQNNVHNRWRSSVYPNPTNGELNLYLDSYSENTKIDIRNALGEVIFSGNIKQETTLISLASFPPGIYILRVLENDEISIKEKIVKE
jgi:hypothetical protein